MTSLIRHITVDCTDPYALAGFWSEVTGNPRHPDDKPDDTAALVMSPDDGPKHAVHRRAGGQGRQEPPAP